MFYLKIAALGSVALFSVNKSFSQTTTNNQNLNEVIIQSSRLQIPLSDQNRNVEVISAEEIKKLPAKSINEILSYVSGVDVRQRGPFGTQADISLDGGSFEQTLILLNGIKISDHQTAHNSLNIPVLVEAIERIEILRGPAARVYGVNSLTGAINIVTKSPEESNLFLHAFGGTNFKKDANDEFYNGRGLQLGLGIAKDKHAHQVYTSHESGSGYRYNTVYHNNRIFYQGEVTPNQYNKIDFLAGHVRSSFGANGFYAAPGDIESKEIVSTTMASVRSKHQLHDRLVISPQLGYRYNFDDYRYFKHDLSRARSKHYSHSLNAEINANYKLTIGDIGFGLESRYEEINSNNIGDHERYNHGLYGEFRTSKIENVNLNVGAYVNYNSVYGWQVFPGIDLSYQFTPGFKAVFNTGTSQRIPSFTDLYLDQRPGNIGNANLSTETAYQVEGGFKYQAQNWQAKAVVFYREIDDFIDWNRINTSVPWQANNAGQLNTTGFNFQTQYNFNEAAHNWKINLGYTYLSPEFKNESLNTLSKYKIENLRHQVVAKLGWQHKNWSALIAERYLERVSYKNYFLTDVRVNLQQNRFDYYLDFQNIFDVTYVEAGAVPMPGAWLSLGLKYKLDL